MTVTRIEEVTKAKCRIEVDQEFAFVLYKGELRMFHIKEGRELLPEDYQEITRKILPKRAKLRAMNLLKSRPYTEYQLSKKLKDGGYTKEIIEEALDYVKSFHYVDDRQYAMDYMEYHKEDKSRSQMFKALLTKGISQSLIQECFEEVVGEDKERLEEEQILRWISKKNFCAKNASYEETQRMQGFLYRKGFSIDAIRSVLLLDITSNNV